MGKLFVLLALVLGTVSAGHVRMSRQDVQRQRMGVDQEQTVEPQRYRYGIDAEIRDYNTQDMRSNLVGLRQRQINSWVHPLRVQTKNQDIGMRNQDFDLFSRRQNVMDRFRDNQDQDEQLETELEDRYNRVPLNREILGEVRRNQLPTVDVNNDRLLRVGRRRQQERNLEETQEEQRIQNVMDDKDLDMDMGGNRLYDQRRQQLLNVQDNLIEGIRRDEGVQRFSDRLQSVPRDDEHLVHINRRRLGENIDNRTPQRVSPFGVGRRVIDVDQMRVGNIVMRKGNSLGQVRDDVILNMEREQERFQGRRLDQEQFEGVQRLGDNLQSVARNDKRLVHINRRRLGQDMEISPRRINTIGESRRVGDVEPMPVENIVKFIRKDNRLGEFEDEEVLEMLRRNRQRKEGLVGRRVDEDLDEDENDVQRLNKEGLSPRRINPIGEGRRVGVVDPITEEDIVKFIRKDNRLDELSDDEILEMLRRNRQRKEQDLEI